MQKKILFPLVFTSGFVVMTIELLGGRILAPYFGGSIYIWGSIITVFMLALSLGYLWGGRLSLHQPDFRKFGLLFLLSGMAVLPIILISEPLMDFIFDKILDPRYGSLAASVLLFFVPTVILGMITPYSVRLSVQNTEGSGQVAGRLYFVSTLGSAAGTLLTSFYFVLYFAVDVILLSVVLLMLMSGGLSMLSAGYLKQATI